jgi:uncharacterized membrane protein
MASNSTYQRAELRMDGLADAIARHWFALFCLFYGIFIGLPFLAPALMHWGLEGPARALYYIYSFLCHQLPERSLFLFGPKTMYPLGQIQAAWKPMLDPSVLRQFIGNAQMGWKVAWSDRMVSMYSSVLLCALLWWPLRHRIRPLPWWGFLLLLLPMAIDGTSHFISDLWGIEQGFRQSNLWLVTLTHNALPAWFYAGNALGSFNSDMRWLSGLFFGLAVVWFTFPHLKNAASTPE